MEHWCIWCGYEPELPQSNLPQNQLPQNKLSKKWCSILPAGADSDNRFSEAYKQKDSLAFTDLAQAAYEKRQNSIASRNEGHVVVTLPNRQHGTKDQLIFPCEDGKIPVHIQEVLRETRPSPSSSYSNPSRNGTDFLTRQQDCQTVRPEVYQPQGLQPELQIPSQGQTWRQRGRCDVNSSALHGETQGTIHAGALRTLDDFWSWKNDCGAEAATHV